MDLVFVIGQYHLVSFALNSFGVERDDGLDPNEVPFPTRLQLAAEGVSSRAGRCALRRSRVRE